MSEEEKVNSLSPSEEDSEDDIDSRPRNAALLSQEIAKEFIDAYRKHRILWDPSHKHYKGKYLRAKTLDEMVPILRQCDPTATRESVRRQINTFRTNYRKVQLRHLKSKTVINGRECYTFKPNWRYYELQKFLGDIITQSGKGKKADHAGDSDSNEKTSNQNSSFTESRKKPLEQRKDRSSIDGYSESVAIEIVDEASNEMFKLIGKNVALKLKRMREDQRYQAELLINKILINALRGRLNDATDVLGLPSANGVKSEDKDDDTADFDGEIDDDSHFRSLHKPFVCQ